MANKFVPTVWSTRTLAHLDKALVYGDLVNTDYEGEIKNFGDSVKINQLGPITVSDYDPATGLSDAEELTANQVTLTVDKAKTFNFKVEDILAAQANVDLVDKATQRAAYAVAEAIDTDIATKVTDAGIKVGTSGAPIEVDADNIYDTLVDLDVKLSENNVDKLERFIVLPPALIGLLVKDARFTRNDKVVENGIVSIGKVASLEVRESNNVPLAAGKYSVMAGSKSAVAYAGQITHIEGYRPEKSFSDAVKGLFTYGVKVIQPKALAHVILKVKTGE